MDGVEELKALKNPKDPPLSAAGTARAERLAAMLAVSKVNAIYVTQYQRTALLAAPLANTLGMTPTVIQAGDTAALVART